MEVPRAPRALYGAYGSGASCVPDEPFSRGPSAGRGSRPTVGRGRLRALVRRALPRDLGIAALLQPRLRRNAARPAPCAGASSRRAAPLADGGERRQWLPVKPGSEGYLLMTLPRPSRGRASGRSGGGHRNLAADGDPAGAGTGGSRRPSARCSRAARRRRTFNAGRSTWRRSATCAAGQAGRWPTAAPAAETPGTLGPGSAPAFARGQPALSRARGAQTGTLAEFR